MTTTTRYAIRTGPEHHGATDRPWMALPSTVGVNCKSVGAWCSYEAETTDPSALEAALDADDDVVEYDQAATRAGLLAALSHYDDGTGTLRIVVDQAIKDDPFVTADDVRAILDEAIYDAKAVSSREQIEALESSLDGLRNDARYWDLRRTYGDHSREVLAHLQACARVQRER